MVGSRLKRHEPDCSIVKKTKTKETENKNKQSKKQTWTRRSVQQDSDGPSPTVCRPLTNMLVPQAEKPVASFMKRF